MLIAKSLIFLSFIILSLHAQDAPSLDEVWCAAATFPDVCPAIYDPVCVDSPKQCFTTPCYQTDEISNGCEACKTEGVQRYTPGKCQYTCDPINLPPPVLDTQDNPVCASYCENCQDASCRATFNRATVACQDTDVVTFSLGACEDDDGDDGESDWDDDECYLDEEFDLGDGDNDVQYCTGERPEACLEIYLPVCVVECLGGDCRRTAGNACEACSDPNVLGYIEGECEPEKIQCPVLDLSAIEVACTLEYDPVCGYTNDCSDGVTAGNACQACLIQGKDYYTRGACEDNDNGTEVEPQPEPEPEPEPECGDGAN